MEAGDPQSFNRYTYVSNDPVNMSDPSGLDPTACFFNAGQSSCSVSGGGGGGGYIGSPGYRGGGGLREGPWGLGSIGSSQHMGQAELAYEYRVNNSFYGGGSGGGEEFPIYYLLSGDGSLWTHFSLSSTTTARLAWQERGAVGDFGFRLGGFANGVTGGFVNWVHRRMGRLDEGGQAWLESQSEYSNAATAGVVVSAILPIPGPGKLSLAKTLTGHAALRLATRETHVTSRMIQVALSKGQRFYDPKNGTINYILRGGFASGKDLLVGRNPFTHEVTTILTGRRLSTSRMIPLR